MTMPMKMMMTATKIIYNNKETKFYFKFAIGLLYDTVFYHVTFAIIGISIHKSRTNKKTQYRLWTM